MPHERSICIHGHFYQPPRENPWLEAIELQDSAFPYHDWNERISAECYASNASSRILDGAGQIEQIVNNYSRISFNFGPTLLAWLKAKAPGIHEVILAADGESMGRFGGHGSALAQGYNHMIMPLANARDKRTQIVWGVADFVHRFGRQPEGLWLPETAVDVETLELMAEAGLAFTVLAPRQARRVRKLGAREWIDAGEEKIDPTQAYVQQLPSGRSIALFFYDGPIARAVAFEDVLRRGEHLAHRLAGAFSDARDHPQLVHIATDGETFGHHHRHGEMALTYALHFIEQNRIARLTNYGDFLERHPPTHEVEIHENSSWSCIHGIERWRLACGCASGMNGGWNQEWRQPLREALDWLRDTLTGHYERQAGELLSDPWGARDAYVDVILDRSRANVERFLAGWQRRPLAPDEQVGVLEALELQRHAMLMYTSCGWFFDELSGIETVQVIQYAGRALQLARKLFATDLEPEFLERLERAQSNLAQFGNGRQIYERTVRPAIIDLPKVGAHYAVSSLFTEYPERAEIYCFDVERLDGHQREHGRARISVGRARIVSRITWETSELTHAVLHMGDHNIFGGVRPYQGEESYQALVREMTAAFSRADQPEVIRLLDRNFAAATYSLRSLFRDKQRAILTTILAGSMDEVNDTQRRLYEQNASLMRFVSNLGMPLPRVFRNLAELALTHLLAECFEEDPLNEGKVRNLLEDARASEIQLDAELLEFNFRRRVERLADELAEGPVQPERLGALADALRLVDELPFEVNLWHTQNVYWRILGAYDREVTARAARGDVGARQWLEQFHQLGALLGVKVATAAGTEIKGESSIHA